MRKKIFAAFAALVMSVGAFAVSAAPAPYDDWQDDSFFEDYGDDMGTEVLNIVRETLPEGMNFSGVKVTVDMTQDDCCAQIDVYDGNGHLVFSFWTWLSGKINDICNTWRRKWGWGPEIGYKNENPYRLSQLPNTFFYPKGSTTWVSISFSF